MTIREARALQEENPEELLRITWEYLAENIFFQGNVCEAPTQSLRKNCHLKELKVAMLIIHTGQGLLRISSR